MSPSQPLSAVPSVGAPGSPAPGRPPPSGLAVREAPPEVSGCISQDVPGSLGSRWKTLS